MKRVVGRIKGPEEKRSALSKTSIIMILRRIGTSMRVIEAKYLSYIIYIIWNVISK